ncbi:MAG: hypothetical protein C0392_06035 [Syntrophus sp. (in: bacteria)]|nr:hypothetical protein [Syntrophus sp. (in: bacteria)]
MAKKILLADTTLSWIKDTTTEDSRPKNKRPVKATPPRTERIPVKRLDAAPIKAIKGQPIPPIKKQTVKPVEQPELKQHAVKQEALFVKTTPAHPDSKPVEQPENKPLVQHTVRQELQKDINPEIHKVIDESRYNPTYATEIDETAETKQAGNKKQSMLRYWLSLAALICVAFTVPEPYKTRIFLGFILLILVEISYRVGEYYHQQKTISDNLAEIRKLLSEDKDDYQ